MAAYNKVYLHDISEAQGRLFLKIRDRLPGVDEKWFIESYMKSNIRRLLDRANPKYANMSSPELIRSFMYELYGDYESKEYRKGEEWGGFLPQWVGLIYARYQWHYNISSSELIDILPLSEMERIFPTLHQTGLQTAIEKIHDEVLFSP